MEDIREFVIKWGKSEGLSVKLFEGWVQTFEEMLKDEILKVKQRYGGSFPKYYSIFDKKAVQKIIILLFNNYICDFQLDLLKHSVEKDKKMSTQTPVKN